MLVRKDKCQQEYSLKLQHFHLIEYLIYSKFVSLRIQFLDNKKQFPDSCIKLSNPISFAKIVVFADTFLEFNYRIKFSYLSQQYFGLKKIKLNNPLFKSMQISFSFSLSFFFFFLISGKMQKAIISFSFFPPFWGISSNIFGGIF